MGKKLSKQPLLIEDSPDDEVYEIVGMPMNTYRDGDEFKFTIDKNEYIIPHVWDKRNLVLTLLGHNFVKCYVKGGVVINVVGFFEG